MPHKDIELHREILEHFGDVRQMVKFCEEMNECGSKVLALVELMQSDDRPNRARRLIEKKKEFSLEFSQMLNLAEQMKLLWDIDYGAIMGQELIKIFGEITLEKQPVNQASK